MTAHETSIISPSIQIGGTEIVKVTYKGEQVVTFAMIDKVHGRPEGTAKRNFDENRGRFSKAEDYVEVGRDEIRTNLPEGVFSKFAPSGILITRRGYLKLTKPMNDDRSWEVQGEMIERYFVVERQIAIPANYDLARIADTLTALSSRIEVFERGLPVIVDQRVESALAADSRRAVREYVSVRQLLDDAKAKPKGRRSLNMAIGYALRARAALAGGSVARRCAHSNVWLFQHDFATGFMRERGYLLVADHNRDPAQPSFSIFDGGKDGRAFQ